MVGLYDPDGILRFTGRDREACLAYAKLFELDSARCSLMALPEAKLEIVKRFKGRPRLEVSSN